MRSGRDEHGQDGIVSRTPESKPPRLAADGFHVVEDSVRRNPAWSLQDPEMVDDLGW
jgi:hypothetical protein